MESTLTSPIALETSPGTSRPSRLRKTSTAILGSVLALLLSLVGITLIALAAAFPMVVQLAHEQNLAISAKDLELATTFASAWWVFAIVGGLTLIGTVVTAVKLLKHLDPAPTE